MKEPALPENDLRCGPAHSPGRVIEQGIRVCPYDGDDRVREFVVPQRRHLDRLCPFAALVTGNIVYRDRVLCAFRGNFESNRWYIRQFVRPQRGHLDLLFLVQPDLSSLTFAEEKL